MLKIDWLMRFALALSLAFVLVTATRAPAQAFPQPLFPRVQMVGAVVTPLPDGWYQERSSVELDALRYQVSLANDSTVALVIDQPKFRGVFAVRLGLNGEVPVRVRWLDPSGSFTKVPASLSTPDSVQIEPGKSATWTMVIERADGLRFTWGDYRVMLIMSNLRPVVSSPGGGTWGGVVSDRGLWLRLVSVKAK